MCIYRDFHKLSILPLPVLKNFDAPFREKFCKLGSLNISFCIFIVKIILVVIYKVSSFLTQKMLIVKHKQNKFLAFNVWLVWCFLGRFNYSISKIFLVKTFNFLL